MNICEKHSMTMIEIGCEKCIEEIVANARNEGFNEAIAEVEEKVKHRLKGLKQLMCTSGERVCPDYTHCHGGYDDERGERHITIIKWESFEKILNEIKALKKPASQESV